MCFVLCRSNTGPLLEVELELGGTDIAWKPELAGSCKGSLQALVQRWLVAFLEVSCLRTACIGQGMPCKKWLQLCMKRSCADAGVQLRVMHVLSRCKAHPSLPGTRIHDMYRWGASSSAWTLVKEAMLKSWKRTMPWLSSLMRSFVQQWAALGRQKHSRRPLQNMSFCGSKMWGRHSWCVCMGKWGGRGTCMMS